LQHRLNETITENQGLRVIADAARKDKDVAVKASQEIFMKMSDLEMDRQDLLEIKLRNDAKIGDLEATLVGQVRAVRTLTLTLSPTLTLILILAAALTLGLV